MAKIDSPSSFVIERWLALSIVSATVFIVAATGSAVWHLAGFVTAEDHEELEARVEQLETKFAILSNEVVNKEELNKLSGSVAAAQDQTMSKTEINRKLSCVIRHLTRILVRSASKDAHRDFHVHIERDDRFTKMQRENLLTGSKLQSTEKRVALFSKFDEAEYQDWLADKRAARSPMEQTKIDCTEGTQNTAPN